MNCPRCEGSVLEEHQRDGVTVDGCRSCRGIWLDRGELERMIARALRDFEDLERPAQERREPPAAFTRREPPVAVVRRDDDRREYDRDDDHRDDRYPKRRKRWLETLGDIFD